MLSRISQRIASEQLPSAREPAATEGPGVGAGEKPAFKGVLASLAREIDRGETLVDRASRAGHAGLGAADLIALQAGIYRYSEAVDLAAKLVDRTSSAVKTTLQGSGG